MSNDEAIVLGNAELTALVFDLQDRLDALEAKTPVHVPAPVYGSTE